MFSFSNIILASNWSKSLILENLNFDIFFKFPLYLILPLLFVRLLTKLLTVGFARIIILRFGFTSLSSASSCPNNFLTSLVISGSICLSLVQIPDFVSNEQFVKKKKNSIIINLFT